MSHTTRGRPDSYTFSLIATAQDLEPVLAEAAWWRSGTRGTSNPAATVAPRSRTKPCRTLERGGTPEVIAAAAGGHWDIEALHHVRDTTMNEDAERLRAGSSAQVIATVRNTAVAALRLAGFTSTAPGRRWAARNPARPIAVLNLALREGPTALAASPQLASCRLVQAERHALVVAARTGVFPSWSFRPAGVNLAAKLTDAPDRSVKIRDAEEDHEPRLGGFVHSPRDACGLDRRAVAAAFVKLPAEQRAVKNLRPLRVWHPDLEMRRLSHTTYLSSAKQHRVIAACHEQPAVMASTAQHAPRRERQRSTARPR